MRRVGSDILGMCTESTFIGRRHWFGSSREWEYHVDTARYGAGRLVKGYYRAQILSEFPGDSNI